MPFGTIIGVFGVGRVVGVVGVGPMSSETTRVLGAHKHCARKPTMGPSAVSPSMHFT
jgi:hypothetical protein